MKNLVAYYTYTGNTEVVAKEIQQLAGGELAKIEEVKKRKPNAMMGPAFSALIGLRSRLKPMDFSLKGYDNIFLCAQVWAGHSTPAINSFLGKADFKGKKVFLFMTRADEKTTQVVIDSITARIEKRGGKVVDCISLTTKWKELLTSEAVNEPVSEWIRKTGIVKEST